MSVEVLFFSKLTQKNMSSSSSSSSSDEEVDEEVDERRLLLAIKNNDIDTARQLIERDMINCFIYRDDGELTIHLREAKFYERKEITEMIIDSPMFDPEECSIMWGSNVINAILESDEDETFEPDFKIKLINKILQRIIYLHHQDENEDDDEGPLVIEPYVNPEVDIFDPFDLLKLVFNNEEDDEYLANFLNNVNMYNRNQNTPLLSALIHWNDIKVIEFLLEKGANPNNILLHHFSRDFSLTIGPANQRLNVCKLLIKYGANPNFKMVMNNGKTPFMCCVQDVYTATDVLDYLAKKSDIDIQDDLGNTAFIYCIIKANDNHKFNKFVHILLRHNPEFNIRNNNGQTVFDIIGPNLNPSIVDILREKKKLFFL